MKDLKCKKHPKYKGKKKPSCECFSCLEMYLFLHKKPRFLPKPTLIIKDKSKYNRKEKHKGKIHEK